MHLTSNFVPAVYLQSKSQRTLHNISKSESDRYNKEYSVQARTGVVKAIWRREREKKILCESLQACLLDIKFFLPMFSWFIRLTATVWTEVQCFIFNSRSSGKLLDWHNGTIIHFTPWESWGLTVDFIFIRGHKSTDAWHISNLHSCKVQLDPLTSTPTFKFDGFYEPPPTMIGLEKKIHRPTGFEYFVGKFSFVQKPSLH